MKKAFTLTEVLIAVAIVGIIAGLVLPKLIENYQTRTMDSAFQREVQTIEDSINSLAVTENKADFFSTIMYKDTTPENYDDSAGMYMKKYLRTSKMCDSPEDCFADTYYQYVAGKSRSEYKPDYKGACAILKTGMSICMLPQIGNEGVNGIIDLNGKKGPNVLGKDLRSFSIAAKTRVGLSQDTEGVRKLDWTNLKGGEEEPEPETPPAPPASTDPCDEDYNSLECCKSRSVTDSTDACCTYDEIKNSNNACSSTIDVTLNFNCYLTNYQGDFSGKWYYKSCSGTASADKKVPSSLDIYLFMNPSDVNENNTGSSMGISHDDFYCVLMTGSCMVENSYSSSTYYAPNSTPVTNGGALILSFSGGQSGSSPVIYMTSKHDGISTYIWSYQGTVKIPY